MGAIGSVFYDVFTCNGKPSTHTVFTAAAFTQLSLFCGAFAILIAASLAPFGAAVTDVGRASECRQLKNTFCDEPIIGYISPFAYTTLESRNGRKPSPACGPYSCPFPKEQQDLRWTLVSLSLLVALGMGVQLCYNKLSRWPAVALNWSQVLLAAMWFSQFVLDVASVAKGYEMCEESQFKVEGPDGITYKLMDWQIEECEASSFVGMCVADLGMCLATAFSFYWCRDILLDGSGVEHARAMSNEMSNMRPGRGGRQGLDDLPPAAGAGAPAVDDDPFAASRPPAPPVAKKPSQRSTPPPDNNTPSWAQDV